MTPAEIKEMTVAIHYAGLIPGLTLACAADALALSSLVRPLGPRAVRTLGQLHRLILLSLLLLWASGLALLWLRLGPMAGTLTPKLAVKVGMVSVLSFNALVIGQFVLPRMATCTGALFGALAAPLRLRMALVGAVSTACWSSALALGLVKALAPMGFVALTLVLGPVILVSVAGGIVLARMAPWLATLGPEPSATPAHG